MRRKIPSLQALLCFESAARHASYTHASQELFLTQSAVSRQIQQLENYLDVPLFTRTRHGVELTYVGQQYFKSITPYLKGLEQTTLDVIAHKGQGGTLKLGVVPTFATRWLLPKLQTFNQLYPEITVHLETSTRPFEPYRDCRRHIFLRECRYDKIKIHRRNQRTSSTFAA